MILDGQTMMDENGTMREDPTREEYTKVLDQDAREFMCPYRSGIQRIACAAAGCMAWIRDVDEKGYPVGAGAAAW